MKVEHKIVRVGDIYQIQRKFNHNGKDIWITKRNKVNGDKPGPFVQIEFLNTTIDNIRDKEPDGKKSIIRLSKTTKKHLNKMGFCKASLERIVGNDIGRFSK